MLSSNVSELEILLLSIRLYARLKDMSWPNLVPTLDQTGVYSASMY